REEPGTARQQRYRAHHHGTRAQRQAPSVVEGGRSVAVQSGGIGEARRSDRSSPDQGDGASSWTDGATFADSRHSHARQSAARVHGGKERGCAGVDRHDRNVLLHPSRACPAARHGAPASRDVSKPRLARFGWIHGLWTASGGPLPANGGTG